MRSLCLYLLSLMALVVQAQSEVTGRVIDARTEETLAFVPINLAGTDQGTLTDIDGRFELEVPALPARLRLSYVGYRTLELDVTERAPLIIRLEQVSTELRPVVVSSEDNPAHRIIRRAYANRKQNDGMRYRSYRYTSYGKTVFDLQLDSAIVNDTARMAKLDTSTQEAYKFSEQQHLLLIESATKKSFIPPASAREEVLAMRVSGLKDPSLLAMAAQTETFSIYDGDIGIGDKRYLGPLAPSSTAKYRFNLEDTLYQGADSVYVISYRPRKGTHFNALKGLLYIHTDGYAVQNVTAEPVERDGMSVRFQQVHEQVSGKWFPRQLNTFMYMDNVSMNDMSVVGVGRVYLKEVEVDADVARKEVRGPELVADRMHTRRDDEYWKQWRVDSLDQRDLKTYATIDSIGDSLNFDKKLKWISTLFSGRLTLGPVELPISRLFAYNGYEGFRLGVGLYTNDKVSRYGSIGGYVAYGFADKVTKYGGDLTIKPVYGRDLHLKLGYENDVNEMGGVAFAGFKPGFFDMDNQAEQTRLFYANRMDRIERYSAQALVRVSGSTKVWVGTERTQRVNMIGYRFNEPLGEGITRFRNEFLIGAITADVRWAFREKIARLPQRDIALGTKYPVVHLQAMRAVKGLWEGEWDAWRVNAMIVKTFRIRLLGRLSVRVLGGMADPDAPMPFLYNLRGTNAEGEFLISAENTFETMRPNEFLADRYATLHVSHSFGNLLFKTKRFKPVPVLLTSVAVGSLEKPENHSGLSFRDMEHAYIESGLRIDGIFMGIGAGVFYRYGVYSLPDPADNFVFKLSAGFRLE
ncbi:MAG: carboxypeptidase-like regulatory domain-containing protein [Flavobacteriales bacterium]|nr:carboxypeptidase-like regulatory domain-containing protein [Flavobacteriales bacterium]